MQVNDSGLYTPAGIFDMDETYFTLSDTRKVRRLPRARPGCPRPLWDLRGAPHRPRSRRRRLCPAAGDLQGQVSAGAVVPRGCKGRPTRHCHRIGLEQQLQQAVSSGWRNASIWPPAIAYPPAAADCSFFDGADVHDKVDFLRPAGIAT